MYRLKKGADTGGTRAKSRMTRREGMEDQEILSELEIIAGVPLAQERKGKPH